MLPPQTILSAFEKGTSFLAHIHLGPDADSLGSVLALKLALEGTGKIVHLFCEDRLPDYALFLPEVDTINHLSMSQALATFPHDFYLSLDTAKWPLATHQDPPPPIAKPIINLDHHLDNSIGTRLNWVEPRSSSTAEMVHSLLQKLRLPLSPSIATCLLFGLMGDTGTFHHFNTKPATLRLAATLEKKGADYDHCLLATTRSLPFSYLKAWEVFLKNLTLSPEGDFVYSLVSYEDWQKYQTPTTITLFANLVVSRISGTNFGAVMVEKTPGLVSGSIRSRLPEFDVTPIASRLSGGGHPHSAGFRILQPSSQALITFLNAVSLAYPQLAV